MTSLLEEKKRKFKEPEEEVKKKKIKSTISPTFSKIKTITCQYNNCLPVKSCILNNSDCKAMQKPDVIISEEKQHLSHDITDLGKGKYVVFQKATKPNEQIYSLRIEFQELCHIKAVELDGAGFKNSTIKILCGSNPSKPLVEYRIEKWTTDCLYHVVMQIPRLKCHTRFVTIQETDSFGGSRHRTGLRFIGHPITTCRDSNKSEKFSQITESLFDNPFAGEMIYVECGNLRFTCLKKILLGWSETFSTYMGNTPPSWSAAEDREGITTTESNLIVWKEAQEGVIKIDISELGWTESSVYNSFKFLHNGGRLPTQYDINMLLDMSAFGNYYEIPQLKDACEKEITSISIDLESVLDIIKFAEALRMPKLLEHCEKIIDDNIPTIIAKPELYSKLDAELAKQSYARSVIAKNNSDVCSSSSPINAEKKALSGKACPKRTTPLDTSKITTNSRFY